MRQPLEILIIILVKDKTSWKKLSAVSCSHGESEKGDSQIFRLTRSSKPEKIHRFDSYAEGSVTAFPHSKHPVAFRMPAVEKTGHLLKARISHRSQRWNGIQPTLWPVNLKISASSANCLCSYGHSRKKKRKKSLYY